MEISQGGDLDVEGAPVGKREMGESKDREVMGEVGRSFPYKEACALAFICFSNAYGTCFVFSIVGYMVVDLGEADDVDAAGYYAGYVASAFMFGRLCSSPFWGCVSDKFGRKPVILCGCLSVVIFCAAFGMSGSLVGAMVARLLQGLTNGITATAQTMASEIHEGQYATPVMSIVTSCWSLGLVIGPSLSGVLARPAVEYPSLFSEDSLFARKPYLLPSLIPAVLGAMSLVVAFAWLPETVQSDSSRNAYTRVAASESTKERLEALEEEYTDDNATDLDASNTGLVETTFMVTKNFIVTSGLYSGLCFIEVMIDEVIPLWAVSSVSNGGLEMRLAEVGRLIAFGGVLMLVYQTCVYRRIADRIQLTRVFRYTCVAVGMMLLIEPAVVSWLHRQNGSAWFWMLFVLNGSRVAITSGGFTAISVLANNAVPQRVRGRANGISMAVASAFMMIAPTFGAVVFATSIHSPHLNFFVPFLLAASASFSAAILAAGCLPGSLNSPPSTESNRGSQ